MSCTEIEGCLEGTREIAIRLKMIQLGFYNLRSVGAGSFLVHHHDMLGPYFGDVNGNEWPHIPLHNEPTPLENSFNEILMKITFEMSNQTLKNVSILDLPAFGSKIGTLRKGLKEQFMWPIKTNFALIKTNQAMNKTSITASYKTLKEDWADYLNQIDNKNHKNFFTPEMRNNKDFDFTRFIMADMRTFLIAIEGKINDIN